MWYAAKQVDPGANGDLGAKAKALPKADGDFFIQIQSSEVSARAKALVQNPESY